MKPGGSPSDPITPHLFKEVFSTLAPYVLKILNGSLDNGVVPTSFKHAVVTALMVDTHYRNTLSSNFDR